MIKINQVIKNIINGTSLSKSESQEVMDEIIDGKISDICCASYLTALSSKGESTDEIAGAAASLINNALRVELSSTDAIDLCGTGGDGKNTFNISTIASLVVAGAGAKVAKHGNKAVSSSCGSADLLQALGINIHLSPKGVKECIHRDATMTSSSS